MPELKATKKNKVLKVFESFGFQLQGNHGRHGNHLVRGAQSVAFPNYPEFSIKLIRQLLKETDITLDQWRNA